MDHKNSDTLTSYELGIILLLAAIQFAHIVDFVVLMPLGPTMMKHFGINPTEFAILASSYSFSAGFAGIAFGMIADRFDRKSLLNFFFFGFIVGTFFCATSDSYETFLVARIITGAFGGVINSIVYAIVPDIIPYERRGKALGIIMSAFSAASILGVPLGVAISDYLSWNYSFLFIAIFSIIIYLVSYFKIPKMSAHINRDNNAWDYVRQYGKTLINKNYRTSFLLIFLASGSMFMLIPFLSPFAVSNMKIDHLNIKYMYLIGGCVTIITARIFGKLTDGIGAFKLFFILCLLSFIPVLLFTHAGEIPTWNYFLYGTMFMSLVSGRMIPCFTLITEIPSDQDRGSFMSVLNSLRSFGSAALASLGGLIVVENQLGELEGYRLASYISVAMGLITILLAYDLSKKIKSRSSSSSSIIKI